MTNDRDCCHVGKFVREARERETDPGIRAQLVRVEVDHAWKYHLQDGDAWSEVHKRSRKQHD